VKVLLFIDSLGSGGAQRQIVTLAAVLNEQGFLISFLVYNHHHFFKLELDKLNIPIHILKPRNYIERIWLVRNYIRKGRYDVVISFLDTPNFLNNFSAIGGRNWKIITSERSSKNNFKNFKGKIYGWFQRYSDEIVCNSYNALEIWEKNYPQYKYKLSTIYNPVLLPKITEIYIPKKDGKLHIVIAASYQSLKNPLGLIEAIAQLSEQQKRKLKVDWYGEKNVSNEGTNTFKEAILKIKKYKLESIISLNGPTKDVANKMYVADVVALFSEFEGLPNAICEGMMLGKPIIMSRVSDYQYLVDKTNGILCDFNRPSSIKKAIVFMMERSDKELFLMGQHSHLKAKVLFSRENITKRWIEIINQL
jgi:glycosyltransferase involved in cell wall biosynthesis